MSNTLYKNYWSFGFKTRLYDLMSPLGYIDSIRTSVKRLELVPGDRVLDAGCGTGLALEFVKPFLLRGECDYTGIDLLSEGLNAARSKTNGFPNSCNINFAQANLSEQLPFKSGVFSKVLVHFSVYTLGHREERVTAWRSIAETLESGGILVAANPSRGYNPKKIIKGSLALVRQERGRGAALAAQLLYPLTERFGLRHIKNQMDQSNWHAYSLEEFHEELKEAGLTPVHSEAGYCESGWLIVAKKL